MTAEERIKKGLRRFFEKIFDIDKMRFDRIMIRQEIIDQVIEFAGHAYPKEFVAFFDGKIRDKVLIIEGLVYHHYMSSEHSATPIFHFNDRSFYGSVHSHPSYSNRPSRADIQFFRKMGIVHAIVCRPFSKDTIRFYDHNGGEIDVEIVQD